MMKGNFQWLLLAVGMVSTANANPESSQAVTSANNLFSFDFYNAIRNSNEDNFVVSPISVATVFAMLQAGARGESHNSIRSTFHFPADDQLNSGYHALLQELRSVDNVTLEMANRIYPAVGYALNPQFSNTLKTFYAAEPQQLDYAASAEAAEIINAFVSNATLDKIQDVIDSYALSAATKLVLVNGIYFKGNWKTQFRKEDTRKKDFYVGENEQPLKVEMMSLETDMLYGYIPELDARVVSIPYSAGGLSMIILLPNQRFGLVTMEEKMKSFSLEKIENWLSERRVVLWLPKFTVESTINLQESLTNLGLGGLFSPEHADLSGISESIERLVVSSAIQKAFIEVNEEGSEAAAATTIIVGDAPHVGPLVTPPPPIYFNADHPYAFVLAKNTRVGGLTLFSGRVSRPNQF